MPNLPVVGKVPKGWVIAVGVGSVAALGYVLWRRHQAAASSSATTAAAAPAATSGDQYPPDGTVGNPSDPNSTDPETGMTYGDEQLYGGGFGGVGLGGFGFPGSTGTPGGTGGTGGPGPGSFTTNADWAQYAEQQLSGVVDPTALSAALGVYLTGRMATSDQESLIDQAIAVAGYPPVSGPDNYPPNIKQSPGGGGGGGGSVPNVVGQNWLGAIHQLQAAGFKPSPAAKPGNATDPVTSQSPAAGTTASKGATVTLKSGTRR